MGWKDAPLVDDQKPPAWEAAPEVGSWPNEAAHLRDRPSEQERLANAPPSGEERPTDVAQALALGGIDSTTIGDEVFGLGGAVAEKGKQGLRALGLMDEEERVSDELRQPGYTIRANGQTVEHVPPSVVADSGREEAATFGDSYRGNRDVAHYLSDKAAKDQPAAYHGANVASLLGLATGLRGSGAPMAATLGGRLAQGGVNAFKVGAAMSAGGSRADLTKGEVAQFVGDAEDSAMLSVPFGMGGNAFAGRQMDRHAKSAQQALEQQARNAEKAVNSARGALGGETSAGFRTLEQLERALTDPSVPEEIRAASRAFLQSEAGVALRNQVLGNAVVRGQDQLGRIAGAQANMSEAAANATPAAVERATEKFLSASTLTNDVLPRAMTYAMRGVAAVTNGLVGGGDTGKVASTIVGAQMGAPGTALGNLMRHPRFVHRVSGVMGKGSEVLSSAAPAAVGANASDKLGEYLGGKINPRVMASPKYGPALKEAADKGGSSLAVQHYLMSQKDPEYRALQDEKDDD